MEIAIIVVVALFASLLTFFSGFGLGTILLPAFLLFFDEVTAIALTGVVHLLNNIFKFGLMYKHIHWEVFLKFGIPAVCSAFLGAYALISISDTDTSYSFTLFTSDFNTSLVNIIIGCVMILFAIAELINFKDMIKSKNFFFISGGLLSGFFGGLSGHQGALRSAFLVASGMTKEMFVATGVIIAIVVDFTRIPIYVNKIGTAALLDQMAYLGPAILAAFGGAYFGKKLLKKVKMKQIQYFVAILIFVLAILLILGVLAK